MQIKGKTAVVTGGTDGIGIEIARHLKVEGAAVIVVGRDPVRLETAGAEGFEPIAADLSTVSGCDALIGTLAGRAIDILVNNAGMAPNTTLASRSTSRRSIAASSSTSTHRSG